MYFEILQDLGLVHSVPRWYLPLKPNPVFEANNAQAFWDVPLFAEHQEVGANRVYACIINHESKRSHRKNAPFQRGDLANLFFFFIDETL